MRTVFDAVGIHDAWRGAVTEDLSLAGACVGQACASF